MRISVVPSTKDHDWKQTETCPRCGRPIYTLRRGTDYGRQRDCLPGCGKPT